MRGAFGLGFIVFLTNVFVNLILVFNGAPLLGIFCLLQTILVFSVGVIWLIRQDDFSLHFHKTSTLIPLVIFLVGYYLILDNLGIKFYAIKENVEELGNLMLSRYQVALWFGAVLGMLGFVLAGGVMRRSQK